MWQSEPMRHMTAMLLANDLEAAARVVAHEGVLHLMDVRELADSVAPLRPYDVVGRLAEIDGLLQSADAALSALAVPGSRVDASVADDVPVDLRSLATDLQAIEAQTEALRAQGVQAEDAATQLDHELRQLRALAPLGVPIETLRELRYVVLEMGLVPSSQLGRLRDTLARVPHVLTHLAPAAGDGRALIAAIVLGPDQDVLQRALRSFPFERVEVPKGLSGQPAAVLAQLEAQLVERQRDLDAVAARRSALAEAHAGNLLRLRARLARERLLVEARSQMGTSERIGMMSGWVPASVAARVEQVLRQRTANRCLVEWRDPSDIDAVRSGRVSVPILLRNPLLVRPFERVVRNFGLPGYGEIEPTPIVALGFLTMFGFMFGDVGQGFVLFGLGYFIYRRLFRYRDYAVLLMECGVFSAVFGFLYGSVFGVEDWLPALWLRPLEDMARLMATAIAFGVAFLSLGLVLNIVNAWRRRDWGILWDRHGVLAALAYWVAVGLALRRLLGGPGSVSLGMALLWLAGPLALLALKQPVTVVWRAVGERRHVTVGEVIEAMVEAVVELLDSVIGAVSNTATFIRLAAFALSHAGLFLATFSVADAVTRAGGGSLGAGLVIVFGNVLIIVLEGLIVSIQTLRLEYYEFFSRFYSGGGEAYQPLRLGVSGESATRLAGGAPVT